MAVAQFERYSPEVEQQMQNFFCSLSEKDRRRSAALQAVQLGHGGIEYVASVLGCSTRTISRGIEELDQIPDDPAAGRVRRRGGGRKKTIAPGSELEQNLKSLLKTRTGGDPDEESIVFTDLTPQRLEVEVDRLGTPVSDDAIRVWLREQNVRLRKIQKTIAGGSTPDRDTQFLHIADLINEYHSAGQPYFSVDTKAKEFLGQLFRQGRSWCSRAPQAFDHDFPSWADGVLIPHGIYDPARNRGHINLGLSHDTSQFACDSLKWYWNRIGRQCYPDARSILLLFDCGGSNAAAKHIVKYDLQMLSNSIGLAIRVAHYPSYCSKYNPIERRLFPHVTRACTGMLFDTLDRVVELMRNTSTRTGLATTVNVIHRCYEIGRNATNAMKQLIQQTITRGDILPNWNYTFSPQI